MLAAAVVANARGVVDVLVLKPMVLGGLRCTMKLARSAQEAGLRVVLTSSIDSALGRASAAHLAAALDLDIPCGLATGAFFESDVAVDVIRDAHYMLPDAPGLGIIPDFSGVECELA